MTDDATAYEGWAYLELMGHRRHAGFVREVEMYGGKQIRIDIPTDDGDVTKFYGAGAIYALSPCSEEVARDLAEGLGDPRPVKPLGYRDSHLLEHHGEDY